MLEQLNDHLKPVYERYYNAALNGGCDIPQARKIASEHVRRVVVNDHSVEKLVELLRR